MKTRNVFTHVSFFCLLLFSSPSWADVVMLFHGGKNTFHCHDVWGTSHGTIADTTVLTAVAKSKIGQTFRGRVLSGLGDRWNVLKFNGLECVSTFQRGYSCNPPNEINPDTGICGEPDVDEGWCESDEYNEKLFAYEQRCAADHPNHYTSVEQSCTDSNNYNFKCVKGSERPDDDNGDGDNGDGDNGGGDTGGGDNGNGGGDNGDGWVRTRVINTDIADYTSAAGYGTSFAITNPSS